MDEKIELDRIQLYENSGEEGLNVLLLLNLTHKDNLKQLLSVIDSLTKATETDIETKIKEFKRTIVSLFDNNNLPPQGTAAGSRNLWRAIRFDKTTYGQALYELVNKRCKFPNQPLLMVFACSYFFIQNTNINPVGRKSLTVKEKQLLKRGFRDMDKFYSNEEGLPKNPLLSICNFIASKKDRPQALIGYTIPKGLSPNNKLANSLGSAFKEVDKNLTLRVAPDTLTEVYFRFEEQLPLDKTLSVNGVNAETIEQWSSAPYTEFDRSIMDAICSYWQYGNKSRLISIDMIYRIIVGKQGSNLHANPAQEATIRNSIDKMRHMYLKINADAEMRRYKVKDVYGRQITKFRYGDMLLSVRDFYIKAGGQVVKGYKINDIPVLLEYASYTNQILTFDSSLFDLKKISTKGTLTAISVLMNERRIIIRDFLMRRIEIMRHDKSIKRNKQNSCIRFDAVYAAIGLEAPDRTVRHDIKNFVFLVLDNFKAQRFIAGYEPYKEHSALCGVDIKLNPVLAQN